MMSMGRIISLSSCSNMWQCHTYLYLGPGITWFLVADQTLSLPVGLPVPRFAVQHNILAACTLQARGGLRGGAVNTSWPVLSNVSWSNGACRTDYLGTGPDGMWLGMAPSPVSVIMFPDFGRIRLSGLP